MKKTALFLVVMLVVSIFALSSCDLISKIPVIGDWFDKPCEEHVDANGDYICDNCEAEIEKNDTPPCEHKDENKDHNCDLCEEKLGDCEAAAGSHNCSVCGKKLSDCAAAEGSHNCSVCGEKVSDCSAAEGSHNCSVCGEKVSDCVAAEKSHNCSICGEKLSDCADEDGNYICDICGEESLPEGLERVNYSVDIADLPTGTAAEDIISSKFVVVAGTTIRTREKTWTNPDDSSEKIVFTKSVQYSSNTSEIQVNVPGTGELVFWAQNGSSSAATQKVKLVAPDGTEKIIEFAGNDDGSPVVKLTVEVTEGKWSIFRGQGNTVDIYALELSCIVEKSEENGFAIVSNGTVDYLCGQQIDLSGLRLEATYANGKTEPLTLNDVTVDTSAVNLSTSGTYVVTVSYKDYAPISYNVNVYLPESITLGFDAIEKLAQNSSAGNGVYFNHSFKELYFLGEELDFTGLSVIVNGICGETKKSFNVGKQYVAEYDAESFAEAGEKEIIIKYQFGENEITETVIVHVCTTEITPNESGVVQALVDPNYLGIRGDLSGPYHVFNTIQQALDFLANVDAGTSKELSIAPGTYKEKLEITIPNLTITGVGETADEVVIEWDSLYGLEDASGFSHVTDSTATVAIRDGAYNCTIKNITISNAFNSKAYFDETLGENYPEHRALALLVMADKFVMQDSVLLGYQDTVELFTGRQYFKNVVIHGYTDFIFGTNNTTLFEDCVINTIYSGKSNGGYLTAFKGSNKGANDAITYGAIFYHCKFTADEGVANGLTAIGRPWGAYAAVAIIECELGSHIATTATGTASQNERYVIMSGVKPTDSTVQFVEYNNTGAGAITEAVPGMRFLTAEEAALYVDLAVIFGKTNGKVTYLTEWNPNSDGSSEPKFETHAYHFDGQETPDATNYSFTEKYEGSMGTLGGLTIDATNGKFAYNAAGYTQFNKDTKLIFDVKAGSTVIVNAYPGQYKYTINGVAATADTTTVEFAEDTTVEIIATGGAYVYSIIIQSPVEEIKYETHAYHFDGKETPEATNYSFTEKFEGSLGTLGGLTIDATNGKFAYNAAGYTQFNKDTKLSIDVKAGSTVIVNAYPGQYKYTINGVAATADTTTVEFAEDTTVEIIATGGAYVYSLIIISPAGEKEEPKPAPAIVAYHFDNKQTPEATNHVYDQNLQGTTGTFGELNIDATIGKLAVRDSDSQFNAGTKISFAVKAGATVTITSYPGYHNYTVNGVAADADAYTITAEADGTVEIVATSTSYLYSIIIIG